jgi:hypothetical protein
MASQATVRRDVIRALSAVRPSKSPFPGEFPDIPLIREILVTTPITPPDPEAGLRRFRADRPPPPATPLVPSQPPDSSSVFDFASLIGDF